MHQAHVLGQGYDIGFKATFPLPGPPFAFFFSCQRTCDAPSPASPPVVDTTLIWLIRDYLHLGDYHYLLEL